MQLGRRSTAILLAACVTSAVAPLALQSTPDGVPEPLREIAARDDRRIERRSVTAPRDIDITINVPADAPPAERLSETAAAAMRLLDDWFRPFPHRALTVVVVPWNSEWAGASYPGVIAIRQRWLELPRDARAERLLIAALARQYWLQSARPDPDFLEGVVLYSATRTIHEVLGGRNWAVVEALGGFFSYPVRAVQLSPNLAQLGPRVRDLPEVAAPPDAPWRAANAGAGSAARRAAEALHTLERYIGWPALQQALAALSQDGRGVTPSVLAGILREQRGVDLTWYFDAALAPDRHFDYAVEQLTTGASPGDPTVYKTVVSLRRIGPSIFAGTSRPRAEHTAESLPVSVRLADGTDLVAYWDGRDATSEVAFESRVAATGVTVDPYQMLLLDDDRINNSRQLERAVQPTGVRLALHWFLWLQDVMLSSVSLL